MNFEEILNKKPSQQYNLKVEKRTMGDFKMNGGNDYKLISPEKSVPMKILKKGEFGRIQLDIHYT